MGMTLTEKILAAHCDRPQVKAGDLIFGGIDLVLSVDVGTAPTVEVFNKMGAATVFDPQKIVLINDHFVPAKDIDAADLSKQMKMFARSQNITHYYKSAGISCIIAIFFARIFYRNAINIGMPILECVPAVENSQIGDVLEVDLKAGCIKNISRSASFTAKPFSSVIQEIIDMGGLVNFVRGQLKENRQR